eukprot:CAMPEP_0196664374 /NCGR_PEP_ID=MMETSP1086-20130531/56910_1 /TAXON_ID=77921 /ORGANISM="Cyanoptyche  gloeocystis , Strain SAG4.97" /LENGTH=389 /DNA_ID=CAMNT_0042000651 /DNA_START=215 /DNA_END=1384 /DNA_ORIENTATION=-
MEVSGVRQALPSEERKHMTRALPTYKKAIRDSYDQPVALAHLGQVLFDRYLLDDSLGRGSFGEVYKAYDCRARRYVALKIIKDEIGRSRDAKNELEFLQRLNRLDPTGCNNVVRLKDHLVYEAQDSSKHICLVFEMMEFGNLYHLLVDRGFRGLPLDMIRRFGYQILQALVFLHQNDIVHCDLKPENLLIRDLKDCVVKVADLGSACRVGDNTCTYVQSRYYRSPEVLLGFGYSTPVDIWSLGCILVELYTGRALFKGENPADQLRKIVDVLGLPPRHLLERSRYCRRYFDDTPATDGSWSPRMRSSSPQRPPGSRHLRHVLGIPDSNDSSPRSPRASESLLAFLDLVRRMLVYDPSLRITPTEALDHRFFQSASAVPSSVVSSPSAML